MPRAMAVADCGANVAPTIYFENTAEERELMGISDTMLRISVGIEDTQDLIADFDTALNTI